MSTKGRDPRRRAYPHSFEDVWAVCDKIPGSFTELNARTLYSYAVQVPENGVVVEVGVDQGRSASLLLAAAEFTGAMVMLIDSWESILIDNYHKVSRLRANYPGVLTVLKRQRSVDAAIEAREGGVEIDLVHIDANHYEESPGLDCMGWLPLLKVGGVALFHDYRCTFPAVDEAVDRYTGDASRWDDLGVFDCLAVRRKRQ